MVRYLCIFIGRQINSGDFNDKIPSQEYFLNKIDNLSQDCLDLSESLEYKEMIVRSINKVSQLDKNDYLTTCRCYYYLEHLLMELKNTKTFTDEYILDNISTLNTYYGFDE